MTGAGDFEPHGRAEGAGYTVWRFKAGRWWNAHRGHDAHAARAVYDQLRSRNRGAVVLLDPAGRELALHVGRVA